MLRVRHISIAGKRPLVALAAFEKSVEVWDYASGERVAAFETILDFGGSRLALSLSGDRLLAAAWERHGLACYDTQSGRCVWQRRDLKKVQRITRSRDGTTAYCGIEGRPCLGIAIADGRETGSYRATRKRVESPYSDVAVLERATPEVLGPGEVRRFRLEGTRSVLSWAIGPQSLLLSEMGGAIRCIALASGDELWRHSPPPGTHFLELAYSGQSRGFLGVSWSYERGGPRELAWLDADTGEIQNRLDLGLAAEVEFSPDGRILVSSSGAVYDTSQGSLVGRIPVEAI